MRIFDKTTLLSKNTYIRIYLSRYFIIDNDFANKEKTPRIYYLAIIVSDILCSGGWGWFENVSL